MIHLATQRIFVFKLQIDDEIYSLQFVVYVFKNTENLQRNVFGVHDKVSYSKFGIYYFNVVLYYSSKLPP